MNRYLWLFSFAVVLAPHVVGQAQTSSIAKPVQPDYSKEAAVVEEMSTRVTFDNGGNSTREQTTRVRVQTDSGVKQWGLVVFPFQSAVQTVEVDYVRVRKVDGSVVVTPPDNIQDLDAEITRSAPFYSDLRERHVAVKGLSTGDILEYKAHWQMTKPLAPGQFWFQYNFQREGIVLNEHLEIKVPAERAVKVKGPKETQTVSSDEKVKVYGWSYSGLESVSNAEKDEKTSADRSLGRSPPPDVQLSSFQTWEEVGSWYLGLQQERIEPTTVIRAKAAELTRGLTTDDAKLQALYNFVSTQYRYIGIAFGIGRYQPHAAEDVLGNSYGDCKDKHTLLAALLRASGFTIYPALISSSQKIDPEIPSPSQFDHVIGYLPRGNNEKRGLWLDTTPEVSPVGYLVNRLRDKQALVMAGEKSIQLMSTPLDPPMGNHETFRIEGQLGDDGTLDAVVEDTSEGDTEVFVRAAFRQVPQPKWKELAQQISYALGFAGTVSDVKTGVVEAISEPFHLSYSYNRKDYPTWKSDRQFMVPGLSFTLPTARDDAKNPLWLGSTMDTVSESKVKFPSGYEPQVPANVDVKYGFAEYHASYSVEKGSLLARRRLATKVREIPADDLDKYRTFLKSVRDDVYRYVTTTSSNAETHNALPSGSGSPSSPLAGVWNLPNSDSAAANQSEIEAREQVARRDVAGAISSLQKAVVEDPKFTRGWVLLGMYLLTQKRVEDGTDAFHKAIALAPTERVIQKAFGYGLMSDSRFSDAVSVWQDYIKAFPDDVDGGANLGTCLLQLKRYSEAVSALEAALKIKDLPNLQVSLGSAYLDAGEVEKGLAVFRKIGEMKDGEMFLNDVAYKMATADLELPLALEYAERAVRAAETESQKITLDKLSLQDVGGIFRVAAYWDTLGWVMERMSNLESAERYLRASWQLTQDGVVAGHLCHLYKRNHQINSGIKMCRLAVYGIPLSRGLAPSEAATELAAAQENLRGLTGTATKSNVADNSGALLSQERTFKLPRFLPGTQSAEFFVLLASDKSSKMFKVEDVKFISGSDKMKVQGKQLKNIDFRLPAPGDGDVHFVRRGILGCYEYTGCSFVLLDAASVQSLN